MALAAHPANALLSWRRLPAHCCAALSAYPYGRGVFYGYLRLSTNSLWPVALAHGAFNTIWSALAALTVPTSALWMEYLSGESGIITLILAMIAVSFLLHRLATPETPIYVREKLVRLETA